MIRFALNVAAFLFLCGVGVMTFAVGAKLYDVISS